MNCFKVDLYSYFGLNIKHPKGSGELTCMLHDVSAEYCPNRLRPAMVVFPGGGYFFCSDRENEPVMLEFFSKNYNCFSLIYSTKNNSQAEYPIQLLEGVMAIAYIRENADKLNVDSEHIASIGFSAGGHLCAMVGNIFDDPIIEKYLGKQRAKLCRPDAVVLSYPVISSGEKAHKGSFDRLCGDDENLKKQLSMEYRVKGNSVPAFIWATVDDDCVPCENSLMMATEYKKLNIPFELHIFAHGSHGLSLANEEVNSVELNVQPWVPLCETWLKSRGFKIKDIK